MKGYYRLVLVVFFFYMFGPNGKLHSQSISERYNFILKNDWTELFISDGISVGTEIQRKRTKEKKHYLYTFKDGQKIDSLVLLAGNSSTSLVSDDIIIYDSSIYFFIHRPERLLSINSKTGKFSIPFIISLDSISIYGLSRSGFISKVRHIVSLYDPKVNRLKAIFDFVENADDLFKEDIGTEHPVGIGGAGIFSFASGDKILIKTGYNEAGRSFACIYYIVNVTTGAIEKMPFSHFELLLSEPRDRLKSVQNLTFDSTSVDIREMYFDINDSVGYIPYHFPYDEKIDSTHTKSRTFKQDAFVINQEFQIIGRVLEREVNVRYSIYERGKKVWNVIYSHTDSLKSCFFKVNFNYELEKSFYDLFYDKPINQKVIKKFDSYELSLLRNFIFAKHNYHFKNQFYQAFFNTFAFYSDEDKRRTRRKNVDASLTAVDKNNLSIIRKILNKE